MGGGGCQKRLACAQPLVRSRARRPLGGVGAGGSGKATVGAGLDRNLANPFRSLGEMACWLAAATGSRWLARAAARGAPSRQCGYGSPTGWKGRWRRLLPAVRWGPWRRLPRPSGWRPWWSTPSPPRACVPLICVEAYVTPRNLSARPVLPKRWSAFALPVRLTLGQVLHGLRFSFPVCWRRPRAGPSSMPS